MNFKKSFLIFALLCPPSFNAFGVGKIRATGLDYDRITSRLQVGGAVSYIITDCLEGDYNHTLTYTLTHPNYSDEVHEVKDVTMKTIYRLIGRVEEWRNSPSRSH